MDYKGIINAVCDDGETAGLRSYNKPWQQQKLDGSLHGFHDARFTIGPDDLKTLLECARQDTISAMQTRHPQYWFFRCREAEIEWCANVYSAVAMNSGLPTIVEPTARGMLKAADIVGVAS